MKYDVFISYSRKDSQYVNALINRLRSDIPGIKIWYDIDGIETAEAFRTKIIKAIDQSDTIIFACSNNSLDSEYCEKEVMYAYRKKKTVVPYLLPGMELDGWLLFEFGNINCIHANKADEVARMIKDLKKWSTQTSQAPSDSKDVIKSNPSSQSKQNSPTEAPINLKSSLEFDSRSGEFKQKANTGGNSKVDINRGFINGHEYVDLGLPSGLKWATCNVGASRPEEYGYYFAWGETKPKKSYDEENCETYFKNDRWLRDKGYVGLNGHLSYLHDAAYQNWGGSWRMPSLANLKELIDFTTLEWSVQGNKQGYKVKSKVNANYIFIPAAGWMEGNKIKGARSFCRCWISQPSGQFDSTAMCAYFSSSISSQTQGRDVG